MKNLLLTYYGDDFTGSTDVLEAMTLGGAKTVLFLDTPQPEELAQFSDVQVIGIAGISRAISPEQMEQESPAETEGRMETETQSKDRAAERDVLSVASGCVIGTHFKVDGDTWNPVDGDRVKRFMDVVNSLR